MRTQPHKEGIITPVGCKLKKFYLSYMLHLLLCHIKTVILGKTAPQMFTFNISIFLNHWNCVRLQFLILCFYNYYCISYCYKLALQFLPLQMSLVSMLRITQVRYTRTFTLTLIKDIVQNTSSFGVLKNVLRFLLLIISLISPGASGTII